MSKAHSELVCVEALTKHFPTRMGLRRQRALEGIGFGVREGEIFGFVGPNGAGKTTTLKILMGLIRPTSGRASVLGHDVRETAFRRFVGFLPENPYFYEFLTGREILRFYARLCGLSRARAEERSRMLLAWVGLSDAAEARLRTYSKGMLQRIGIAQALVHDPSLIFLDEPMSGLDPLGRKEIRDLIVRLQGEGKTVFMNTHILSDVEALCDRVAILVKGRIRYEGRTDELVSGADPKTEVVLGQVPLTLAAQLEERGIQLLGHSRGHGGRQGARIELRVHEKEVSELLRMALAEGAEILSVQACRPSLESIFLAAVAKSASEEVAR